MAAAGAGGGHIPPDKTAYFIFGHGMLESAKADKVVPAGFTIVTNGKCGFPTRGVEFYREIIKGQSNPATLLAILNPESEEGIRFLAKTVGPVLLEKEGTNYIETIVRPFAFHYGTPELFDHIVLGTSGVIQLPCAINEYKITFLERDQLLSEIDIPKYFANSLYPTSAQVKDAISKAILLDLINKDVIHIIFPTIESKKAISIDRLRGMINQSIQAKKRSGLEVKFADLDEKLASYTLGEFVDNNMKTFTTLIDIRLSELLSILPKPGVVYSPNCRVVATTNRRGYMSYNVNPVNAEENAGVRKNIIRRQIEEAELSRKRFARAKVYPELSLNATPENILSSAAAAAAEPKIDSDEIEYLRREIVSLIHKFNSLGFMDRQRRDIRKQIEQHQQRIAELLRKRDAAKQIGGSRRRRKRTRKVHR